MVHFPRLVLLIAALLTIGCGEELDRTADLSKVTRTRSDISTIAIAIDAYAQEHGGYPDGSSASDLAPLLEPDYIQSLPVVDAWDQPIVWITDGARYRIVSGGPDGMIDDASRSLSSPPPPGADDLVFEDGEFIEASGAGGV